MNQLQLNMQRIPTHIKIAFQLLNENKPVKTLENQMTKILNNIGRIGNDCIRLANETHTVFSNLMNHLGEIIALTQVSQGLQETRLREMEIELNISRIWQRELTQLNELLKQHYENTVEDLRLAHIDYSRALARRSSKFERGLMRITNAVIKLSKSTIRIFKRMLTKNRDGQSTPSSLNSLVNGQINPTTDNAKALLMAQSLSAALRDFFNIYYEIFYPMDNQNSTRNPDELENILYEMQTYTQLMGNNSIACNIVQPLVERMKDVCLQAIQLAKDSAFGKIISRNQTDAILFQLEQLIEGTKEIDAAAELIDDSSIDSTSYSSDNAKMLVQITAQKLKDSRNRSEMSLIELRKNMNEMTELVGKIASLDLTRINHAQLLDYMQQALRLLATIRQTWGQVVLFFSTIASQTQVALHGTLNPFLQQATLVVTNEFSTEERMFFLRILKEQSETIHQSSYSLFLLSRTYVDMSNEFLMPRLEGLSLMITATNDIERIKLNNQLNSETQITQVKVKALVEERKMTYTTMIEQQQAKLKIYLDGLGGSSMDNQQIIEQAEHLLNQEKLI